jgi:hypothetical protein
VVAESGDWSEALAKAKNQMRHSRADILKPRTHAARLEVCRFDGLETAPEEEPVDASEDAVQEHVDDDHADEEETGADILPPDDVVADEPEPVVTLATAYESYRDAGGNRVVADRVLTHLGGWDVEAIDRAVIIKTARELYPKASQAERAELVHDPLEEILGGILRAPPVAPPAPPGPVRTEPDWWGLGHRRSEEEERQYWYDVAAASDTYGQDTWASISKPVGPPPDPEIDQRYVPNLFKTGSPKQWADYRVRKFMRGLPFRRQQIHPDPVSHERQNGLAGEARRRFYCEEVWAPYGAPVIMTDGTLYAPPAPPEMGRPRKHADNAAKMRAYRQRKKEENRT